MKNDWDEVEHFIEYDETGETWTGSAAGWTGAGAVAIIVIIIIFAIFAPIIFTGGL